MDLLSFAKIKLRVTLPLLPIPDSPFPIMSLLRILKNSVKAFHAR
jgi:hypothetical protein